MTTLAALILLADVVLVVLVMYAEEQVAPDRERGATDQPEDGAS